MNLDELDPLLVVWGVATQTSAGWTVRACKTHRVASQETKASGGVLVYHDPDTQWTDATTKQPIPYGVRA